MIKTRSRVESLSPYVLGKSIDEVKQELNLSEIRKMSENENVYGCSPFVKEKLPAYFGEMHYYPDGMARDLAIKVSEQLGVHVENLVFGNGSDEVIRLLTRAYISAGDEAVMADVTFPRYKTNVFLEEGVSITVPLKEGTHDLTRMLASITNKTKMIFVCNPNNPTGTVVGKKELLTFIKAVPNHVLVIIDEAYFEYVTTEDYLETIPLVQDFSNLVILRTFSKIYGLASLRIGYGVMDKKVVRELQKVKDVFNVNQLAQFAAVEALKDQDFIESCSRKNEEGRLFLEKELKKLHVDFFPSQSNFMMVKFAQRGDGISDELLKRGIIVRAGTLLGYDDTIRVTIGSIEDNEAFIKVLSEILMDEDAGESL
ncbi:histidinol-phosphate transaminase [Bacillus sp. 2205SS5-2]|uniref:histidinol-phosphate transaminase n=1 Tax=Bacillus sp. 2205SS5-2 TaxID=3109031 RepID=UPI00300533D7